MDRTLTVSIGRNVGGYEEFGADIGKLDDRAWAEFQTRTLSTLRVAGAKLHFSGVGVGFFEGQTEESFTAVASVSDDNDLEYLRHSLRILCELYDQQSIALTIGTTEFVG
jgi:hypothetical protein